jgi:predicted secreted protein
MFDDNRSKKVVLVSHCLLNQNSISDGTADLPSQFDEVIDLIRDNRIGIIQLPCPELLCLGLDRKDRNGSQRELLSENMRIRHLMNETQNLRDLESYARQIVMQIEEYRRHGFHVIGLIGINRSPSCGIETTSIDNRERQGTGVFIQVIAEMLDKKGIKLKMTGVKTSRKAESLEKVRWLICESDRVGPEK